MNSTQNTDSKINEISKTTTTTTTTTTILENTEKDKALSDGNIRNEPMSTNSIAQSKNKLAENDKCDKDLRKLSTGGNKEDQSNNVAIKEIEVQSAVSNEKDFTSEFTLERNIFAALAERIQVNNQSSIQTIYNNCLDNMTELEDTGTTKISDFPFISSRPNESSTADHTHTDSSKKHVLERNSQSVENQASTNKLSKTSRGKRRVLDQGKSDRNLRSMNSSQISDTGNKRKNKSKELMKESKDDEGNEESLNWITPTHEIFDEENRSRKMRVDGFHITLQVAPSNEPNAGDGLFLSFEGNQEVWTVPKQNSIDLGIYAPLRKEDEKISVVFEAKNFIFEWKMQEWSFMGDDDIMLDITDKDGEVHELASRTLLPKINEVSAGSNPGQQNVEAIFNQNVLHYVLKGGATFERGKKKELFTNYGKLYDNVRKRKYGDKNRSVSSTVPAFTSIVRSITEYTEDDVRKVLSYFREKTPNSSEARFRMIWATEQIRAYCSRILYIRRKGLIPMEIEQLIDDVLRLFPRPGNANDEMVMEKNQLLGFCVRKSNGGATNSFGMVERVLAPRGQSCTINSLKYVVVFKNISDFEVWDHEDVENNCFLGTFGAFGVQ